MHLKRLVRISVIALSLSVVFPINQVANADDTYERICLSQGWTSCGEWTIYDVNGVQKNRVVGPTPLSALVALCGVNMCGGGAGGSAVLNKTFSPTPGAAEAAAAAAAAALATYNAFVAAQAAAAAAAAAAASSPTPTPTPTPTSSNTSSSDTRTVSTTQTPTPTPTPTPTSSNTSSSDTRTVSTTQTPTPTPTPTLAPIITSGLGGYAVVHPDGHVCGVIVATSSDPFGNGGFMSVEYMGCPKWSRIVFQTTASSSGNVAGWHGNTVTESNGQFKIGGGTDTITVRNGIATNTSGQSWDTGNGAPAAKTTDTKTVVSSVDTRTATVVSNTDTRTSTAPADNKVTSIITITSISNIESRTASAANLLNTYTSTEKESLLNVTLKSTKSAVVNVSSDIPNIKMAVTATKAGSKPIVFNIKTNSEGDGQIKTSKNLTGYTVTLSANGVKLDSDKAVKK